MSDQNRENDEMKKGIDRNLLKRLFSYTKGQRKYILLALFLLIFVVGAELARPIIVGDAVDSIISDYKKPLEVTKDGKTTYAVLVFLHDAKDQYYRVDGLSEEEVAIYQAEYQIVSYEKEVATVEIGDKKYKGVRLQEEDIREFRKKDFSNLWNAALIFVVVTVFGLVISYVQAILLQYTGQKIIYKIREEIFAKVQGFSVEYFNKEPVGKIVTRITNDTETLNEMYTSVIVNSIRSIITLVGISVMMFIRSWRLTLFVFMVIPFIVLSTMLFRKYSRRIYRDVRTKISGINTFLSEHISGMKIVQMFSKEEEVYEKFKKDNESLLQAYIRQLILFSIYRPSMYILYIIALGITLLFGGNLVLDGIISIGTIVIFIQYVSNFFDPIQQLAEQFNILQSAMASAEKIFSILDEEAMIEEEENAIELENVIGEIEFKNVWFAYEEENWVLKDVSFKVKPGETAAFVGATGAGKTSILNLLSRYYEIQKGEILLDGIPIQKIKKSSLRMAIGQMLQDVFIFTGDINSNIRLRNEEIRDEDIQEAATYVNADYFIRKLKDGYSEKTYERGQTYSAGQRQLISFARTLAFKPSILVLDEATANIDTETEGLIQDALQKLMKGRTTLVVAHRLSTIQHADQIIVLHKGRLKEIGNHQELLAKKGIYHKLYELQYQEA